MEQSRNSTLTLSWSWPEVVYLLGIGCFLAMGLFLLIKQPNSRLWAFPWLLSAVISLTGRETALVVYPLFAPYTPPQSSGFLYLRALGYAIGYDITARMDALFVGILLVPATWVLSWFVLKLWFQKTNVVPK